MRIKIYKQLWFQLIAIIFLFFILHIPTLQLGKVLDDIFVLAKCETSSWNNILVNGFKFTRKDFGNPWWIEADTIAHFFRPILIATFKGTILKFGNDPFIHHLINILLHIAVGFNILFMCRKFLKNNMAALIAAVFFIFSLHNQFTVVFIVARKELLVGLFTLYAFNAHLSKKTIRATFYMILAMMCGEHAVAFPFIAILTNLLVNTRGCNKNKKQQLTPKAIKSRISCHWKQWATYLTALACYILFRHLMLSGLPLPPSPYFTHPFSDGALAFYFMKFLLFISSLAISMLFMGKIIIVLWLDHLWLLLLFLLLSAAFLWLAYSFAENNNLFLIFIFCAIVSYLPFTPMVAMPIYLYSPMIFFSFAIGIAVDGALSKLKPANKTNEYIDENYINIDKNTVTAPKNRLAQLFLYIVVTSIILHIIGIGAWTYSGYNEENTFATKVAPSVANIVNKIDETDDYIRPIVLVDVPPKALTLPFLLQKLTKRKGINITIVSTANSNGHNSDIFKTGKGKWLIKNKKSPYFSTIKERALAFVPKNRISDDLIVVREWYRVMIEETKPPPDERGHRFFSTEPSVVSLSFQTKEHIPEPIFIKFENKKPVLWKEKRRTINLQGDKFEDHFLLI